MNILFEKDIANICKHIIYFVAYINDLKNEDHMIGLPYCSFYSTLITLIWESRRIYQLYPQVLKITMMTTTYASAFELCAR